MEKQLQFLLMLYGVKYKERKPLIHGFRALLNRTRTGSEVPGDRLVTLDDMFEPIKLSMEIFAADVASIIFAPEDVLELARRSFEFLSKWNAELNCVDGRFLPGYGKICALELYIPDSKSLICFLKKLRKAREVPEELKLFHKRLNQRALTTSIKAYEALRKLERIGSMKFKDLANVGRL